MAREIRQFTATIPAGTSPAAPITVNMSFPARVVQTVEMIVPPGPNGFMGFAIANSGVRVIPYLSDDWVITDNEKITWPLDGFIDSGSWQLIGYNTGTHDHTVRVRFLLDTAATATGPANSLIPSTLLTGG